MTDDSVSRVLRKYSFGIDNEQVGTDLICVLCKKLMVDAYQSSCGCQYCHECILEFLDKNNEYCCGGNDWCTEERLILGVNVVRSVALNKKIAKLRLTCPNQSCTHRTELTLMEDHLRMCSKHPSQCPYLPIGCDQGSISKEAVLSHLHSDTLTHTELLIDWIQNLRNDFIDLKEDLRKKELTVNELRTENVIIKKDMVDKENRIAALELDLRNMKIDSRSRIDPLSSSLDTPDGGENKFGKLDLTIDRFEARIVDNDRIISPYFYSHKNGYKLALQVFPGGDQEAKGTFLSSYVSICMGEYDASLPWPCKHVFEIGIVNQRTGWTHNNFIIGYDTVPDNFKCVFNKPASEEALGIGETELISLSNLRTNTDICKNDCVVVRCSVSDPR